jgi:uncharacterized membrane protein
MDRLACPEKNANKNPLKMNKARLETFSDGVFAIVITLLILNISIPDVEYEDLWIALNNILPKIFSYIMSFFLIGLYWIGHHLYFDKIQKIDGTFLFLNLILLLLISFLPFPTSLLGKYPNQTLPLVLYGCNLILTNTISFLMLRYVVKNPHLTNEEFQHEFTNANFNKTQLPIFLGFNITFIVAILFAGFFPVVSYALYLGALVSGLVVYIQRMNKNVPEHQHLC